MKQIIQFLERFSFDAVVVAVTWGLVLSKLAERSGVLIDLSILGLATWLTYVADRLWEVRPGNAFPETDRHLYYRNNYKNFVYGWFAGFVSAIVLSVLFLPGWKMMWGWALVASVVCYLLMSTRIQDISRKLLLKKSAVPIIFAAGVIWMSEGWRTSGGIAGSSVLLAAAFANVLLISYWENHDNDNPGWLERACILSLLLMLVCFNAALFVYWPVGAGGLLCATGYYFLFMKIKTSRASYVRAWADGILVVAGVVVIILI